MILLAIGDFLKNIKRNLWMIFLMTAACVVLMGVSSLILYEVKQYEPFSFTYGHKGFYCSSNLTDMDLDLPDGCEIYGTYYTQMLNPQTENDITVKVYDEWICENWQPRLSEGTWFGELSDGNIPTVVGGTDLSEFEIGQTIEVEGYDKKTVTLEVVGIAVEDISVMKSSGDGYYTKGKENFETYYEIPYGISFYMVQKDSLEEAGISVYESGSTIIMCDSLTDEEYDSLNKSIWNASSGAYVTLEEFNANNMEILFQNIFTYMPLAVIGIVMVLGCSGALAYINMAQSSYHYAVFYALGAKLRQNVAVSLGNALGIVALSAVAVGFVIQFADALGVLENLIFEVNAVTAAIAALLFAVFLLQEFIISYKELKGLSPREALMQKEGMR